MRITRLFTASDGHSHFDDRDLPTANPGGVSEAIPISGFIIRQTEGVYDLGWHQAPRRQFVLNLSGGAYGVKGGERRRLLPGDVMLVEDTTGSGHTSAAIDTRPRRFIFVRLAEDVPPAAGLPVAPAPQPEAGADGPHPVAEAARDARSTEPALHVLGAQAGAPAVTTEPVALSEFHNTASRLYPARRLVFQQVPAGASPAIPSGATSATLVSLKGRLEGAAGSIQIPNLSPGAILHFPEAAVQANCWTIRAVQPATVVWLLA